MSTRILISRPQCDKILSSCGGDSRKAAERDGATAVEAIKKFFKKKIKMHWSAAIFAAALMCFFILLSAVAIQPGEFAGTLKNFMAVPVLWLLNAVPRIDF